MFLSNTPINIVDVDGGFGVDGSANGEPEIVQMIDELPLAAPCKTSSYESYHK